MTTVAPETTTEDVLETLLGKNTPCECDHGDGVTCPNDATWRGTVECMDPDCHRAAESILLCEECKQTWEKEGIEATIVFERI